MHRIESLDECLAFHFQNGVGKFLKSQWKELDHRADLELAMKPFQRAIFNFLDSLLYGTLPDPFMTSAVLIEEFSIELSRYSGLDAFAREVNQISLAQNQFVDALKNKPLLKPLAGLSWKEISSLNLKKLEKKLGVSGLSNIYGLHKSNDQSSMRERMVIHFLAYHSKTERNHLETGYDLPFYPIVYSASDKIREDRHQVETILKNEKNAVPVVFLEPYSVLNGDWLLKTFSRKQAIFYFRDFKTFWQCLAFDSVAALIFSRKVSHIIGDQYVVDENLILESIPQSPILKPILLAQHPVYENRVETISDALSKMIDEKQNGTYEEGGEVQRWLYQLGIHLNQSFYSIKFGIPYAMELERIWGNKSWFAKYKEGISDDLEVHSAKQGLSAEFRKLPHLKRLPRRPLQRRNKIRLAHIVPQIVDGGHAPSKLLRTLVQNADREKWEVSVLCHEASLMRRNLYPRDDFCSKSTRERAVKTLNDWKCLGVTTFISSASGSYLDAAYEMAEYLKREDIDVIACHGNDPVNLLIPVLSDVPRRVFVEHSGFPLMQEFDLVLTSLAGNAEKQQALFQDLGTSIKDLPYGVDARADWLERPNDYGVSPQVRMMTTISNHLESRVSGKFVEAIATILQKVPLAVYMPIGPISDIPAFEKRFAPFGVQDRVICLKAQKIPSQVCRGMHLYLNEFPFGSGISMLDAMASGIPVVTMYDEKGVMQARNGGNYIGIDRAIKSLKSEDYIDLAISLITDDSLHAEWREYTLKRYEMFGPQKYIRNFENLVYSIVCD